MDIVQLFMDFGVDFSTEGYKYCRPGWVNVECPFCTGNPGPHLGYELSSGHFNCWRCGWHPTALTIAKLIRVRENEAREIMKKYGGVYHKAVEEPKFKIKAKSCRLPQPNTELVSIHRKYLESRNFDVEKLISTYNLKATGRFAKLDNTDYSYRILIPFFWEGKMVSFDSRDITGKHVSKYMACAKERETIPHKSILYGRDDLWTDKIIIVEGPTDVWRLGRHSAATSGMSFTPEQVKCIAKRFKRVAVCYDGNEVQAKQQANKLVDALRFRKVDAFRVDIETDPGAMSQKDADYLVKQLI